MRNQHVAPAERSPGRPREPEVTAQILAAALELMAQQGYARMSMDQVAVVAGVTKPTIYRRYASKIQLALAAIIAYCDQEPVVYSGETRADLVAQIDHLRRALDRPHGMGMVGTVLSEEHATPDLLANFRTYLVKPRREAVAALLARARERGELRPGADLVMAGAMLVGAYYAQYLAGAAFSTDWTERLVDAVLAGIVRQA